MVGIGTEENQAFRQKLARKPPSRFIFSRGGRLPPHTRQLAMSARFRTWPTAATIALALWVQ